MLVDMVYLLTNVIMVHQPELQLLEMFVVAEIHSKSNMQLLILVLADYSLMYQMITVSVIVTPVRIKEKDYERC